MSRMFIIGSGFTRAVYGNEAPTNAELLPRLRLLDPILWQDISERYQTKDIENALTRLDLDINRVGANQPQLIAERRKIETQLADFFRDFRFKETLVNAHPGLQSFMTSVFKSGDVVVSLNYDCLLEGLLDRYDLWTPNGGYGPYGHFSALPMSFPPSPVTVLKVHGSVNFHRTPGKGNKIDWFFDFSVNESIFPVSGRNRHLCWPGDDSSDAVIAPSFVKVLPSPFVTLMLEALDVAILPETETLVIIGCALRPEDSFLHLLIWKYLQGLVNKRPTRLLVVDPKADEICGRFSETLKYDLTLVIERMNESLEDAQGQLTRSLKC